MTTLQYGKEPIGPYDGPITRSRSKGLEEEESLQKTFLLWKVDY